MLKSSQSNVRNQLQWAVLLLAIAVVLPTVCLLWFMNEAVKNERLVVRQKLTDIYQGQVELLGRQIDDRWNEKTKLLETIAGSNKNPAGVFAALAGVSGVNKGQPICSGLCIFGTNGDLLYPLIDRENENSDKLPEQIAEAWNAEYVENDLFKATQRYSSIADALPDTYTGRLALMGKIRCRKKAGDIDGAILDCRKLAYEDNLTNFDPASASIIAQARLQLASLRKETQSGLTRQDIEKLIDSAINYSGDMSKGYLPLASTSRMFFLSKSIEIASQSRWAGDLKTKISDAEKLFAAEQNTSAVLEMVTSSFRPKTINKNVTQNLITAFETILGVIEKSDWPERLNIDTNQAKQLLAAAQNSDSASNKDSSRMPIESQPQDRLGKLAGTSDLFCLYHAFSGRVFLLLSTPQQVLSDVNIIAAELQKIGLSYRITDDKGAIVAGQQISDEKPFIKSSMTGCLAGWQISLYANQDGIFEKAASRRIAIYIWTGILVIILILTAGAFAAQTVRKQIRLNTMKNDFIATVSHELKTPLASMRVLVDTLLEGNIKDPGQTEEYLRMTSKENERLSRMIDNFLTFSRMERNKKAFNFAMANPTSIAGDAAEAVKTKFTTYNCRFDIEVAPNLPEISADHDAIVTVLVNLLDNACKYTGYDKKISLKVFAGDRSVCFVVADNGIGIPRRHIRRIFDRFYQVDTTLARKVEGCGLGLSIVKFIVDAHKGKINVESKLGKGSTFTVQIPVSKQTD